MKKITWEELEKLLQEKKIDTTNNTEKSPNKKYKLTE